MAEIFDFSKMRKPQDHLPGAKEMITWESANTAQRVLMIKSLLDELVLPGMDIAAKDNATMDMRLTVMTQGLMAVIRILGIDPKRVADETIKTEENLAILKHIAERSKEIFDSVEKDKVDLKSDEKMGD